MITLGQLVVDSSPDALGHYTIRLADGTEHGDTDTCIATVYQDHAAELLVRMANAHADMLNALDYVREQLAHFQKHDYWAHNQCPADIYDAMAKVIAKAEGKS